MTNLIASEFLKLRTTRTFWMLALLSLGITGLTTVAQLATDLPATEDDARSLLFTMNAGGLLMLVLGVISSAGEYRHGTITTTFLVAPDRRRVVFAKSLAIGLMGVGVTTACALLLLAITLPWLSADGQSLGSLGIGGSDLAGIFGQSCAFTAISAMLGVGVGALLTNQIAAIVVIPVLVFVVDPVISLLIDGYDTYSIGGLWTALGGESSEDAGYKVLAPGPAALLYFAYAIAIIAVTAVISQRRDIA